MWHSQETAHDRPHTDSNGVLAWWSVNLTFPTQRCGAVGFLRVNPEEDVNPRKYHDMEDVSEDEVDQIIQRYERDLADLEAGEFQR